MEESYLNDSEKEALLAALAETAGSLSAEDHPEWSTPEKVAAWVRALQQGNPLPDSGDHCEEN